jgi:hypothetical protein
MIRQMEEKRPFEGRPEEPDQGEPAGDAASDRPPWELEPEPGPEMEGEMEADLGLEPDANHAVEPPSTDVAGAEPPDWPGADADLRSGTPSEVEPPIAPPGPGEPVPAGLERSEPEPPFELEPEPTLRPVAPISAATPGPGSTPPVTALPSTPGVPGELRGLLGIVLLILGLLSVAAVASIAVGHLGDRYEMDRVASMWTALSVRSAEEGLYPPLVDDETGAIGGTRAMPLAIMLHQKATNLVSDELISGKVATSIAAGAVALIALIILIARRCSFSASLVLIGIAFVSQAGIVTAASIRAEPIALALQLLAVVFVAASRRALVILFAALLCAAAILTNINAFWAPLAILLWLVALDRRQFVIFLVGFVVFLTAGVGAFHFMTEGRMTENLAALAFAGVDGIGSFVDVFSGRQNLVGQGVGLWALLPLALLGILLAAAQRELTLYHVGLLAALVMMIVTLADSAAGPAAMFDFTILAAICVGDLWRRAASAERKMTIAHSVIAIVLAWASVAAISAHAWPELRELYARWSTGEQPGKWDPTPLADRIEDDWTLLLEDPYAAISLDRTPLILDPWALARLDAADNDGVAALGDRIRARDFDRIVLREPIESILPDIAARRLGLTIATAISDHYQRQSEADGYHIYSPRAANESTASLPGN